MVSAAFGKIAVIVSLTRSLKNHLLPLGVKYHKLWLLTHPHATASLLYPLLLINTNK